MGKRPPVAVAAQAIKDSNGFITHAAAKLDISRTTLHAMINQYATLREAVTDAREAMKDFAENKLFSNIKDGKETSLIFYLKTQAKDRGYVERQEVSGPEGKDIEVTHKPDLSHIDTDKLKALREILYPDA